MAFTYLETESSNLHKVRGQIGDTIENNGPRPSNSGSGGANFSDEVITATIAQEKVWQRAVANMFERLASEWAKEELSSISSGGQSVSYQSTPSERFKGLAKKWRDRYGFVEDDGEVVEGVSVGTLRLGFQATNG